MARFSLTKRLDAMLARELDEWDRRRKAQEAAEDAAVTGTAVERIERNSAGDIVQIVLANGCKLRPRASDNECWIEIDS